MTSETRSPGTALTAALAAPGIVQRGLGLDPRDNAAMECFSGLLKRQRANRVRYHTRDEGRADLFDHIKVFYNGNRRHGYVRNIGPDDPEAQSTGSF